MSNRTYVNLYVPIQHGERVEEIAKVDSFDDCGDQPERGLTRFGIPDVNYGELSCQQALIDEGIAYDMRWYAGDEFEAGVKHVRFTAEGDCVQLEVFDSGKGIALDDLLKCIDSHTAIKQLILNHQAATVPLPWDNQVEYGKLYRAKQLIQPKGTHHE